MPLSIHIESDAGVGLASFQHEFAAPVAGVFGPSGCGKTTLLETICGMRRPPMTTGRIVFNDTVWLDQAQGICLPPEARNVGYVPQQHLLFPHWLVRQNLLAGQKRAMAQGSDVKALMQQAVDALELGDLLERYPHQLSGGQRQRVALGRALISGAKLLLLDEPLASLDHKLRYRIIPFLQQIRETFQVPMLIVSHQPAELQALCDEVVVMEQGRLADKGSPRDVFLKSEIYSALEDGFENMLYGHVVSHTETLTTLKLCDAKLGPEVQVSRIDLPAGSRALLRLNAHEIMLAKQPVAKISARNRLPSRIVELRKLPNKVIVVTQVGDCSEAIIAAEVTLDAVTSLDLKVGDGVFLVIKSNSFQVCR
ncbi:molybdenum ABC transporter ATP-binding protein [Cerasicoccus frondis]|uniref:molybdenum ABC transporter ATP-binding protein n=1 Tax=Cerasicoccus frondis TaxID=490090 RepID=UPI0028524CC2|nr:molybdenum ABC transporter ATP-binding protein [Cerasicoccus frondis]